MRLSVRAAAVVSTLSLFIPAVASAQALTPLANLLSSLLAIVNTYVIPLLIAAAVAFFFYGLVIYIKESGSSEDHSRGIRTMVAGIVALVVMLTLWGIVSLVGSAFGVSGRNTGNLSVPQVTGTGQVR